MRHVITLEICGEMWQVEVAARDGATRVDGDGRRLELPYSGDPIRLLTDGLAGAEGVRQAINLRPDNNISPLPPFTRAFPVLKDGPPPPAAK